MNILIVSFSFPSLKDNNYDGRFVLSEAIAYGQNDANVKVITPHYPRAEQKEQVYKNVSVYRCRYFFPESLQVLKKPGIPLYNPQSFLSVLQIPFLLLSMIFNTLYHCQWADIIHAQWSLSALLAFPAKLIFGKKIVMTVRGSDIRLLPQWLNKWIHRKVDAVIDCWGPIEWNVKNKLNYSSNYKKLPLLVLDDSSSMPPEDMTIPSCDDSKRLNILYVGRFHPMKINRYKLPLFNLILACYELKKRGYEFNLYYIGGGDSAVVNKMLDLISQYHLEDNVKLLGPKINVMTYIHHCHIGVGGIGLNAVAQEFLICKKAQILMNTPDNSNSSWKHKRNCLFIKPNDINDIVKHLAWAIDHLESVHQIGNNAAHDMQTYIMNSLDGGRHYIDEFKKLINE